MTTPLHNLLIAIIVTMGISACQSASTKWQHASIPQDQWSSDAAQCRYESVRKAEKRLAEAGASHDFNADQDLTINQMMTQEKVSDRAKPYFASCMSAMGYQPVQ